MDYKTLSEKSTKLPETEPSNARQSLCLFFLAFLVNFYATVGVNAAQDVLIGSHIPTSTVVLTMSLTLAIFDVFSTWFTVKSSWNTIRLLVGTTLIITGAILTPVGTNVYLRLIFAATAAAGVGVISIVCVSVCAIYHECGVSAFGAGSGAGNIFATIYYTAMSTWFCLGYQWALPLSAILAPGFILCYLWLTKPDFFQNLRKGYTRLKTSDEADSVEASKDHSLSTESVRQSQEDLETQNAVSHENKASTESLESERDSVADGSICDMTCKTKIEVFKESFTFVLLPVAVTVFSEMTTFQSIVTTIAFDNSPFPPRSHYSYYSLAFYTGLCIMRMYLFPVVQCCPNWVNTLRVRRIWIAGLLQASITVFFLFCSLYRLLPNVWVTLLLIFFQGGLGGVVYVCALLNASDLKEPGFAASLVESGFMVTVAVSCFTGLFIERLLVDHCIQYYAGNESLQLLCLTRTQNITGGPRC